MLCLQQRDGPKKYKELKRVNRPVNTLFSDSTSLLSACLSDVCHSIVHGGQSDKRRWVGGWVVVICQRGKMKPNGAQSC